MLRETVIQYPTLAARLGQNNAQNGALPVLSPEEGESTSTCPPPAARHQAGRARLPASRSGGERAANHFTPSTPRQVITTCINQNTIKVMAVFPGTFPQPPQAARISE